MEKYHCGWWISNDQETINQTLLKAIQTPPNERLQMGLNGKRMIQENYSVTVLGDKMSQLYQYILHISEKPNFVYEY